MATPQNTNADVYGIEADQLKRLKANVDIEYGKNLANYESVVPTFSKQEIEYGNQQEKSSTLESDYRIASSQQAQNRAIDQQLNQLNQSTIENHGQYLAQLHDAQLALNAAQLQNNNTLNTTFTKPADCVSNPQSVACLPTLPPGDWWKFYFTKQPNGAYMVNSCLTLEPAVSKSSQDPFSARLQALIDQRNTQLGEMQQNTDVIEDRRLKIKTLRDQLAKYDATIDAALEQAASRPNDNFKFQDLTWDWISPNGQVIISL